MNSIKNYTVVLRRCAEISLIENERHERLHQVYGELWHWDENYEHKKIVGTIEGYAIHQYYCDFDILDAESQDLCVIAHAIEALEKIDDCIYGDFIIIDRLKIEKAHRGLDLGLHMIKSLIEHIFNQGGGRCVLTPAPTERKNYTDEQRKQAVKKLEKYYAKMGFKKIKGTESMVFNCEYTPKIKNKGIKRVEFYKTSHV